MKPLERYRREAVSNAIENLNYILEMLIAFKVFNASYNW